MPTKKTLVVYYSLEGSTKLIAETIANEMNADIMECKPKKDISGKGFMKYVRGGRQALMKSEPELEKLHKDPSNYDTIIIGTPVRAYTYAPAIRTFLKMIKLQDKKIALFCTHEGGKGKTLENMKENLVNNKIISNIDFVNVKKNKIANMEKAKQRANEVSSAI